MSPAGRPKIGPSLDFATSTRSTRSRSAKDGQDSTEETQDPKGRPSRDAKTAANKNAVWTGAAPTGPKAKDPQASKATQKRKRVESVAKAPPKRGGRKNIDPGPVDNEDSAEVVTTSNKKQKATEVPVPAPKGRKQSKVVPPPEELFDGDDDSEESEPEDDSEDLTIPDGDDSFADDNDDDIRKLEDAGDAEGLQNALEQEKPHWTATNSSNEDDADPSSDHPRSFSRASASSGHMSVPSSNVPSDSESGDEDWETKAALSSLDKAHQLVPAAEVKPRKKGSAVATASAATSARSNPPLKRSKRDIAVDQERPTWPDPPIMKARNDSSGASSHPKVKLERTDRPLHVLPRRAVKQEVRDHPMPPSSSPDIIDVDDPSDDEVEIVDASDIELVLAKGKIGLKNQHPRVEKTAQLAVDYYLGYYIFKNTFPPSEVKNHFALDATSNAAHSLGYDDIKQRVLKDTKYCDSLGQLLHGRVSAFRLRAKTAADLTVVTNYGLRVPNSEDRVIFLLTGMRYIYPLLPGGIDPRSGKPGPDVVEKDKPYMSEGIHITLYNTFFKGTSSLADKYSNLFATNKESGKKELPAAMVAFAGTAVHASLSEYRSGHYVASKFEGNVLKEIYDTHLLLLRKIRTAKSTVLEDLYDSLSHGTRLGAIASKPMAKEALAILGL